MSLILDMRKEAAVTVTGWITDAHGDEVASAWVWECTPMPCGLPSDEQLQEGLSLALGEVTIGALLAKSYREMDEQMAACHAAQKAKDAEVCGHCNRPTSECDCEDPREVGYEAGPCVSQEGTKR